MFFVLERADKILQELQNYIHANRYPIKDLIYREDNFTNIDELEQSDRAWQPFSPGSRWGGRDRHGWFRAIVKIPQDFHGKTIAVWVNAYIGPGMVEDAANPQFMLYINKEFIQGLDINHQEVIIARNAQAGLEYQLDLYAYSGMFEKQADIQVELVVIDELIRGFYYDLAVAIGVARELSESDPKRQELLKVINATVNFLDLRQPFSESFYSALHQATKYLKETFYIKMAAAPETGRSYDAIATCIGHTHIDVAWLWTIGQTREKVARSFSTVLNLMEEYPEYIFMSSQPQLYQFIKEDHPELYARIKERIRQGRWEADGAMWLEADCNLTSGESLVRQILFGTRFFEQEFGVKNKVLWLPDVFGYSAALPQILKKSGIDYFVTTKISWNQFNKLPYDTFMWRGIDGTEILSYFICTIYPGATHHPYGASYNGLITPRIIKGTWDRYQQKEINNDVLIAYGYGDGGGGPTVEMLENARRLSKGLPGCPRVKMGRVGEYLEKLAAKVTGEKHLPKWVGELYLEFHRGTYTSMSRNKRYNRKSEFLYQDVEFLSALAMLQGERYPQADINQGWQTILLNQFHDIIPGSCIKEVYDQSREQYEQLLFDGEKLAAKAMTAISERINLLTPAIVVYNTLSFQRSDLVEVAIPENITISSLLDQDDSPLAIQVIEAEGVKKALFYAPEIPSKGYRAFAVDSKPVILESSLSVSPKKLENRFFSIIIDQKGTISSFYDKLNRREVLQPGERGNKLQAFEDKPMNWDNWDIDIYYQEKEWEIDQVEAVTVIEAGPVRAGIQITKRFQNSIIIQKIYIYEDIARVDFDIYIDWKEDQILLKAAFPVDVHSDKATYDIQFGNVERPTHWNTSWDWARFEVCAHKWADLSEDGFGVSLLNDCKYGYDIKDGNMRLTLLKSGNYPNPDADREIHHFVYSLYPHAGDWREGKTVPMAYSLNVPLHAKLENAHPASLPPRLSLFELDQENAILETVKKAEDSEALVVRIYECYNKRSKVRLTSYQPFSEAWECDLLENDLRQLELEEGCLEIELKPYELKTFKFKQLAIW